MINGRRDRDRGGELKDIRVYINKNMDKNILVKGANGRKGKKGEISHRGDFNVRRGERGEKE